jgi:glycosyltransferase involved in cell wall biosynthesis
MVRDMGKTIREVEADIVHLVAVNPWVNAGMILWRPQRLVTTIHDPVKHLGDGSQRVIPQFVRDLPIRYSHRLIVHGMAMKEVLLSRHNVAADKIDSIPIGEYSIYRHWNDQSYPEVKGTVLFFGRIWPYKGLDFLIAAEPAISAVYPNVRFVIAGTGEDLNRYRTMMVNPDRFEILNKFIKREEVSRLFQQASVVALPYIEATSSGIIPLAYAFAKPVVATTTGSISEVVDHGKTGLLVPPCDSQALAEAVIRLLQDDELRHQMGQQALEKTTKELSWTTIAQQTSEVYRLVMEND